MAEDEHERVSVLDPQWEEAWASEIERRIEEVRQGTVTLRSWEEVRAELHARRSGAIGGEQHVRDIHLDPERRLVSRRHLPDDDTE